MALDVPVNSQPDMFLLPDVGVPRSFGEYCAGGIATYAASLLKGLAIGDFNPFVAVMIVLRVL